MLIFLRGAQGFTLIELLACLSILSILTFSAIPAFNQFIENTQSSIDIGKIADAVQLARATAVTENRVITLCLSPDSVRCDTESVQNIAVFRDDNNNKSIEEGELIYWFDFDDRASLALNVTGGRRYIRFKKDGTAKEFGRIRYCPSNHDARYGNEFIINILGRIIMGSDKDNDGIIEGRDGDNIIC